MNIEPVTKETLAEIIPLIGEYQKFYGISTPDDKHNFEFFSQFTEPDTEHSQFLYRDNNAIVLGFATVYFSFSSVAAKKIAILNDLFTRENARGRGIGRALIEHCHQYAAKHGVEKLQWHTAKDNLQAQTLYDALPTNKSEWFTYSYPVRTKTS